MESSHQQPKRISIFEVLYKNFYPKITYLFRPCILSQISFDTVLILFVLVGIGKIEAINHTVQIRLTGETKW